MNRYKRMRDITISIAIFFIFAIIFITLLNNKTSTAWTYESYQKGQQEFNTKHQITAEIIQNNTKSYNDFVNQKINAQDFLKTIEQYKEELNPNFIILKNQQIRKYIVTYLDEYNKTSSIKYNFTTLYVAENYVDASLNRAQSYLIVFKNKENTHMRLLIGTITQEKLDVLDLIDEEHLTDSKYIVNVLNHMIGVYKKQLE